MQINPARLLRLGCLLTFCCGAAAAQNDPGLVRRRVPVNQGPHMTTLWYEYNAKEARPGSRTELKLTFESIAAVPLALVNNGISADNPTEIKLTYAGDGTSAAGHPEHTYQAEIAREAHPQPYDLEFKLRYGTGEVLARRLPLFVGPGEKGALTVELQTPLLTIGKEQQLRLKLIDGFPDYSLTVQQLTLRSDPAGLFGEQFPTFPQALTIDKNSSRPLDVTVKTAGIFRSLLDGFSKSRKIYCAVDYTDQYGRMVSGQEYAFDIKLRPDPTTWFMAVLLGVLIGVVIKFLRGGSADRWAKKLLWAAGAVGAGFLISLLSLWGELTITTTAFQGSSDNPVFVFFTGLVSAVGGLRLLEPLLGKLDGSPKK